MLKYLMSLFFADVSNIQVYEALRQSCNHWKEDCVNFKKSKGAFTFPTWYYIAIDDTTCPLCHLFNPIDKLRGWTFISNCAGCPVKSPGSSCCWEWVKVHKIQDKYYNHTEFDFINASKEMLAKLTALRDEYAILVMEENND